MCEVCRRSRAIIFLFTQISEFIFKKDRALFLNDCHQLFGDVKRELASVQIFPIQ